MNVRGNDDGDDTNQIHEERERAHDNGVGGEDEDLFHDHHRDELDRRGRDEEADGEELQERSGHDDLIAGGSGADGVDDKDVGPHPEELFGVSREELGEVVSKYAKINQPVPFSSQTPKWRLGLEWHNVNYKVVVPLPPQSFLMKLFFKLPIPAMITNRFKKKKEIPILNNVSGHVHPGQVVAIMGPTGSGKVRSLQRNATRDAMQRHA
jgi:ABC-type multidrug transport system fused ATPase/permease subunit